MDEDSEISLHSMSILNGLAAALDEDLSVLKMKVECQAFVDQFIGKVVDTLLYGTELVEKNRTLQAELEVAQEALSKLENSRFENAAALNRDLELAEESWRSENDELKSHVERLEVEVMKLNKRISNLTEPTCVESKDTVSEDYQVALRSQKDTNDRYKKKLEAKEKELQDFEKELLEVKTRNSELSKRNIDVSKQNRELRDKVIILEEINSELDISAKAIRTENIDLDKRITILVKENMDLSHLETTSIDLKSKIIIDVNDPNRPQCTLQELKRIIVERNDLKIKLSDIEEDMRVWKLTGVPPKTLSFNPPPHHDEDPPVQGPINKEPEEKLSPNKRRLLGVQRFLQTMKTKKNSIQLIRLISAFHQSHGQ